jgi:hypothetical protein
VNEDRPAERRPELPPELPPDGPTELVEGNDGDLVERLSTGTATLLLAWLIGTGVGSALLAAWLFAAILLDRRLGISELFSSLGLYISVFGASGPTLVWLTGRAQGHSLPWFGWTAAKIGLAMIGSVIVVIGLGALLLGVPIGPGFLPFAAIVAGVTLILSMLWALATWAADRYIAKARIEGEKG